MNYTTIIIELANAFLLFIELTYNYFQIYLAINIFLAGYHFGTLWEDDIYLKEKIRTILLSSFMLCFGVIFYSMILVYHLMAILLIRIDNVLQIRFWFCYLFTKRYHSLSRFTLQLMNSRAIQSKRKVFKYAVRLLNKRNNYIYASTEETETED